MSGSRLRGRGQAEVGLGLAQALGLSPGSTLGDPARVGRASCGCGWPAWSARSTTTAASPTSRRPRCWPPIRQPRPTSSSRSCSARARTPARSAPRSDRRAAPATGAVGRGVPLVAVLRSILRAVAIVDGLVCLYALIQACALTVQERRRTVSVLRAFGAGGAAVRRLLAGAVIALVVPAARDRDPARAARARPGAVAAGRELRDAVARRERDSRSSPCWRDWRSPARSRWRGWRARPRART